LGGINTLSMVFNLEKPKIAKIENSQKMVDKDHCQKGNSPEPKIRSLNSQSIKVGTYV